MKRCKKCQRLLPLSMYAKSNVTKDKLWNSCKDCKRIYNKQYYQDHKEQFFARARLLNPGYNAVRRARELGNGSVEDIDRRAVWGRDEGCCRIKLVCDGIFVPFDKMHLDHVIPLSKGGTHTWNNVQVGCAPCNLKKGGELLASWSS